MKRASPLPATANHGADTKHASGWLQRKCACGGSASSFSDECDECRAKRIKGLQPKLSIGAPTDPLEREADDAAERVMRLPNAFSGGELHAPPPGTVAQRRAASAAGGLRGAPPVVDEVLRSPGAPLSASTRAFFEPRFGHDFSRVRVHADARATESATAIAAKAYTVGEHIVFGRGQFDPGSTAGRMLLAHELAHTIQQTSISETFPALVQRKVTQAQASECTREGFTFQRRFTGIINGKLPRKENNFVQRFYYSEIPGHPESRILGSLETGKDVTAGPTGGYGDLWRQVCAKSEELPAQKMWVLNDYIDEKYIPQPKKRKPKKLKKPKKKIRKKRNYEKELVSFIKLLEEEGNDLEAAREFILSTWGQGAAAAAAATMQPEPTEPEPSMLREGKLCHTAVGEAYAAANPPTITDERFVSIIQLIGLLSLLAAKGTPSPEQVACYALRPDVYDIGKQQVYEIKSFREVPRALVEAVLYMNCFNALALAGLSVMLGDPSNPGTSGFVRTGSGWCIYTCPAPGALIYEYILAPENPRAALERLEGELQGRPEVGVEAVTALAIVGLAAGAAIAEIEAAGTYADLIAALVRHMADIRVAGAAAGAP